ncbi:unnamed protein product [Lasius platythorax]|uniref:Uncharacterized protein n=1 Tax=Lasius platythorax TaxID=488582 RepID=A0AAV2NM98_9HYME
MMSVKDIIVEQTCNVNDVAPAATDFIGDARLRYLDRTTVIERGAKWLGSARSCILALYTSYTAFPQKRHDRNRRMYIIRVATCRSFINLSPLYISLSRRCDNNSLDNKRRQRRKFQRI